MTVLMKQTTCKACGKKVRGWSGHAFDCRAFDLAIRDIIKRAERKDT